MADATEPAPRRGSSRYRLGVLVALLTGLAALYPTMWAASVAHAEFSGCWTTCSGGSRPASGLAWSLVVAVLVALPISVGLSVAQVRCWTARAGAALVVLGVVGAWALFSLDPDNAEFFVRLGE